MCCLRGTNISKLPGSIQSYFKNQEYRKVSLQIERSVNLRTMFAHEQEQALRNRMLNFSARIRRLLTEAASAHSCNGISNQSLPLIKLPQSKAPLISAKFHLHENTQTWSPSLQFSGFFLGVRQNLITGTPPFHVLSLVVSHSLEVLYKEPFLCY